MNETKISDLDMLKKKLLAMGTIDEYLEFEDDDECKSMTESFIEVIDLIASHVEDVDLRKILDGLCRVPTPVDIEKLREGACKSSLEQWDNYSRVK